ncbi:uncharacterized protein HD556DRAFT_716658 [Suillus plorans]|uniref:Uncharacterized protein n=1 Tax=Suillus plorans TaxID=116603 RepID=A0A9P7J4T9_9AGAM|nr:uncharacterized protein HD556DRAFT_716658 [Suillus plorans]KAG1802834.1 hypothetical protein HD556DRAFT_716658 [Suillus plorans]
MWDWNDRFSHTYFPGRNLSSRGLLVSQHGICRFITRTNDLTMIQYKGLGSFSGMRLQARLVCGISFPPHSTFSGTSVLLSMYLSPWLILLLSVGFQVPALATHAQVPCRKSGYYLPPSCRRKYCGRRQGFICPKRFPSNGQTRRNVLACMDRCRWRPPDVHIARHHTVQG